jgi:hypothetical protein
MIQQIKELLGAIQSALQGKLHITFINPGTLQNIFRNMTLHLPEGCELIAGTRIENKLATVTLVGNAHGITIIINIH